MSRFISFISDKGDVVVVNADHVELVLPAGTPRDPISTLLMASGREGHVKGSPREVLEQLIRGPA